MAQTVAEIEARLVTVRASIDQMLGDGVQSFTQQNGDGATLIRLPDLMALEKALMAQLAAAERRSRTVIAQVRPLAWLLVVVTAWWAGVTYATEVDVNHSVSFVAGVGIECHETDMVRRATTATPAFVGGARYRTNYDWERWQPPHRSAQSARALDGDLLDRRIRWLCDNSPLMKRACELLVQHTIGDGIAVYSAACDHLPIEGESVDVLGHPLFAFGDEADARFERWAERYADVERRKSLWDMQRLSGLELFGPGNTLWLECYKRTSDGSCPICWQVLEQEQLDTTRDRPAARGQNAIVNGIEYDTTGEAVAYWLWDAHPYDDSTGSILLKSQRIPASRVIHVFLPSRASQRFGLSLGNASVQHIKDTDWVVGWSLTQLAVQAGLTLVLKESDAGGGADLTFDASDWPGLPQDTSVPNLRQVGLSSGGVAVIGKDETLEVAESKHPNPELAPFLRWLTNYVAMSRGLSLHRFTGDPTGASYATLRAMIQDDRSATLPVTWMLGRLLAERVRERHDRWSAGAGLYQSVGVEEFVRQLAVYTDYECLGPALMQLSETESVEAAKSRIAAGLSTLRIECGLLGRNYRRVLRQLAIERDVTAALRLALDFSKGGGARSGTTTDDKPA